MLKSVLSLHHLQTGCGPCISDWAQQLLVKRSVCKWTKSLWLGLLSDALLLSEFQVPDISFGFLLSPWVEPSLLKRDWQFCFYTHHDSCFRTRGLISPVTFDGTVLFISTPSFENMHPQFSVVKRELCAKCDPVSPKRYNQIHEQIIQLPLLFLVACFLLKYIRKVAHSLSCR